MSKLYQPSFYAYPDLDGPLFDHLSSCRNVGAWLREALIVYVQQGGWPAPGGARHRFRTSLGPDDSELIDFIKSLPPARQRHVLRNAAWYQFGRLSVGHYLDAEDIARRIAEALQEGGVLVGAVSSGREDGVQREVEQVLVGQFLE